MAAIVQYSVTHFCGDSFPACRRADRSAWGFD